MRAALAWLWNTLRPDHWRYWGDWLRDWRSVRRFWSRKATAARMAHQYDRLNARVDAVYEVLRLAVAERDGSPMATEPIGGPAPGTYGFAVAVQARRRKLHVVHEEASGER